MTTDGPEADNFTERMSAQNVPLRTQLQLLRSLEPKRRRRFLLLELICGVKCGQPVLEVWKTSPYKTVCYHGLADRPGDPLPVDATVEARIERMRSEGPRIRRGEPRFHAVSDTQLEQPDASELLFPVCDCRSRTLSMQFIAQTIAAGKRTAVLRG